jgi:hypothetical protein
MIVIFGSDFPGVSFRGASFWGASFPRVRFRVTHTTLALLLLGRRAAAQRIAAKLQEDGDGRTWGEI